MKTSQTTKQFRPGGMILAATLLAASCATVFAGETPTAQNHHDAKLTEMRIVLPAMNGGASSVTVWVPKTGSQTPQPIVAKNKKVKEVDTHAPNSPNATIAVWIGK